MNHLTHVRCAAIAGIRPDITYQVVPGTDRVELNRDQLWQAALRPRTGHPDTLPRGDRIGSLISHQDPNEDLRHSIPGGYDPGTTTPQSLGMILQKRVKRIVSDDEYQWTLDGGQRNNRSGGSTRNANLYQVKRSPMNTVPPCG